MSESQPKTLFDSADPYLRLMRMDKPVGSLLLLWPTLAALWVAADGIPPVGLIIVFSLGTVLMRSAGCVMNDYADRNVDGHVSRTQGRPLATGELSTKQALMLAAGLVITSALLLIFLNWPTRLLAIGGVVVAAIYPLMKRVTHMPQAVLGVAFSWGILMADTAVNGTVSAEIGVFFVTSVLWIVAYDTLYAMADREDDLKIGVKSTAILFGELDRLMVGVLQACTLLGFWLMGERLAYGWPFAASLAVVAGLFAYQQWLIRKRAPDACLGAFRNNTLVGFALLLGVVGATYLKAAA